MAAYPRLVPLLVVITLAFVEAGHQVKKIKSNPDGNFAVGFKKGHILSGMYEVTVSAGDPSDKREVLIQGSDVKDSVSMEFDEKTVVFSDWDGMFMLGDKVYTDKPGTLYFYQDEDECSKKTYRSQEGEVVVNDEAGADKSECSAVREKVKRTLEHFMTTPFRYMLTYPSVKLMNTPGFPGGDYVSGVSHGSIRCGQFTVSLPPGDEEEERMIGISGPGVVETVPMIFDYGTMVFGRWDGYFYLGDKVFSVEPHTLVIKKDDGSCEKTLYEKRGLTIVAIDKIPINKEDCFTIKSKAFSVFEKIVGTSMIEQEDREYIYLKEKSRVVSSPSSSSSSSESENDKDISSSSKGGKVKFISRNKHDNNKKSNKVHLIDDDYYNEDVLVSKKYKSKKTNDDFYDEDYSDYKRPKVRKIGKDYYDNNQRDYRMSRRKEKYLRYMREKNQQIQKADDDDDRDQSEYEISRKAKENLRFTEENSQPSVHVSSTVVLPEQTLQGSQMLSLQPNQQLASQSYTNRVGSVLLADRTSNNIEYVKGNQMLLPADSLKAQANTFFYQPGYDENLQEGSQDGDVLNYQYNNVDTSQQQNTVNVQLNDVKSNVFQGTGQLSTANGMHRSSRGLSAPSSAIIIENNDALQNLQYPTSQSIVEIQGNQAGGTKELVMIPRNNKINVDDLANTVLNRALSSSQNIIASDGSVNVNKIIPLSLQQGLNEGGTLNLQSNNVDLSETNKVANIQINDISGDGRNTGFEGQVRFKRSIGQPKEVLNFQKNTVQTNGKVSNIQVNEVRDNSPRLELVKIPTIIADLDPVKLEPVEGSVRLGRSITQLVEQPKVLNNQVTNVDGSVIDPTKPTLVTSIQGNTILAPTGPDGIQVTPDLKATQQTTINIPPNPSVYKGAFSSQDGQSPQNVYIDSNIVLKPDMSRQNQVSPLFYQEQSAQSGASNLRGSNIVSGEYNPNVVRIMTSPTVLTSQPINGQQVSLIPMSAIKAVKVQSPALTADQGSNVLNFQKNFVEFNGQPVSNIQLNDVSQNLQNAMSPTVVLVQPTSGLTATGSASLSAKYNTISQASSKTGNTAAKMDLQLRQGIPLTLPLLVDPRTVVLNVADSSNIQKKKK